jgi:hypothetical protein
MQKLIAIVLAATLAGCASRPESISATHVPPERYAQFDCASLRTQLAQARGNMNHFSGKQTQSARHDEIGLLFFLPPLGKVIGNYSPEVAKYKGEVDAIEKAMSRVRCTM